VSLVALPFDNLHSR